MNPASFCRNCLGNWFAEAANERGLPLSRDDGREKVYGMPRADWKALHQTEATPEAKAASRSGRRAGTAPFESSRSVARSRSAPRKGNKAA